LQQQISLVWTYCQSWWVEIPVALLHAPSLSLSPAASFFRENPACTHRLVPWLSREFTVLLGKQHVDFMIQIIMSLVDK